MKQLLVLVGCVVILSALIGCQNANTGAGAPGQFPKVMVGIWDTEPNKRTKWAIKFEPDGSIKRLVHPLTGPVKFPPGEVYLEGPDPNTHAIFIMGPCEADYYPRTSQLKVKVILAYYKMKLPTGVLEGRIESYLSGPVSKDGQTWAVDLREYPWLEGSAAPDPKIIDQNPKKLVFTKIDLK